jgi:hypothetical protein
MSAAAKARWTKACEKAQMSTKRALCPRKTEGGLEKDLANLWSRKKITKKAHAGRGQETKWEIRFNCYQKQDKGTQLGGAPAIASLGTVQAQTALSNDVTHLIQEKTCIL